MKTELSTRKLIQNVRHVYRCGYCELDNILSFVHPVYYNHGIYGWNCDIYYFPDYDLAITTGYRNLAGINIPRRIIEKYKSEAIKIYAMTTDYSSVKSLMRSLIENMCYELVNMKNDEEETN